MSSSTSSSQNAVLGGALAGTDLGDGLWVLPGQGNALAARTDDGVVINDAGNRHTYPGMVEYLRGVSDDRVAAILYSHGHGQYNAAVPLWLEHNHERGEEPPRLIGHDNILLRYARYRETAGLQARSWKVQFPSRDDRPLAKYRADIDADLHDPNETFSERLMVVEGSRPVEVIWAPSETDDCIAVWYPADGLLFGGPATPADAIPNIGTPLRTQRFTIRWAETLEQLAALGAERLLTEFGPLVEGEAEVRERLTKTAEALRWLRDEVVDRMNRGMGEREVLADLTYPPELFDQPWMTPNYGAPDYIARDLFREENGWWDRNPTTLHPAPPAEAAAAILSAVTDHEAVLARARELHEAGETQLALHVVDLLATAPGDTGIVGEAKALKGELCQARAREVDPYVSMALYWSTARLLADGGTSWQALS
jgi:uncharacterized sulfatase